MKEQILDLIKQHFTAILVKSVRAEDLVSEQSLLNLATRLDKAIGIDEIAVHRHICTLIASIHPPRTAAESQDRNEKALLTTNSITQSRPLKCEVEEKWNENVEKCSE